MMKRGIILALLSTALADVTSYVTVSHTVTKEDTLVITETITDTVNDCLTSGRSSLMTQASSNASLLTESGINSSYGLSIESVLNSTDSPSDYSIQSVLGETGYSHGNVSHSTLTDNSSLWESSLPSTAPTSDTVVLTNGLSSSSVSTGWNNYSTSASLSEKSVDSMSILSTNTSSLVISSTTAGNHTRTNLTTSDSTDVKSVLPTHSAFSTKEESLDTVAIPSPSTILGESALTSLSVTTNSLHDSSLPPSQDSVESSETFISNTNSIVLNTDGEVSGIVDNTAAASSMGATHLVLVDPSSVINSTKVEPSRDVSLSTGSTSVYTSAMTSATSSTITYVTSNYDGGFGTITVTVTYTPTVTVTINPATADASSASPTMTNVGGNRSSESMYLSDAQNAQNQTSSSGILSLVTPLTTIIDSFSTPTFLVSSMVTSLSEQVSESVASAVIPTLTNSTSATPLTDELLPTDPYAEITKSPGINVPLSYVMLSNINDKRAKNRAPPLRWSAKAYEYASKLAKAQTCGGLSAITSKDYAINQAYAFNAKEAINLWYREGKKYRFGDHKARPTSFSNMVWRKATEVACATHDCNGIQYVVCAFGPNNVWNNPEKNVFRG